MGVKTMTIPLTGDLTQAMTTDLPEGQPASEQTDWDSGATSLRCATGDRAQWVPKPEQQTDPVASLGVEGSSSTPEQARGHAGGVRARAAAEQASSWSRSRVEVGADAELIMRAHLAREILADLRQIQQYCGQPLAAAYSGALLTAMRAMRDLAPTDPYLEVVMALHDALAFDNNWVSYTPDQYESAYQVLATLARARRVDEEKAEKAIAQLEKLGFDSTPFHADADFDHDPDDAG